MAPCRCAWQWVVCPPSRDRAEPLLLSENERTMPERWTPGGIGPEYARCAGPRRGSVLQSARGCGGAFGGRQDASQGRDRSQSVLPLMRGTPEQRTHDYVRNDLTTLFAVFDVAPRTLKALRPASGSGSKVGRRTFTTLLPVYAAAILPGQMMYQWAGMLRRTSRSGSAGIPTWHDGVQSKRARHSAPVQSTHITLRPNYPHRPSSRPLLSRWTQSSDARVTGA